MIVLPANSAITQRSKNKHSKFSKNKRNLRLAFTCIPVFERDLLHVLDIVPQFDQRDGLHRQLVAKLVVRRVLRVLGEHFEHFFVEAEDQGELFVSVHHPVVLLDGFRLPDAVFPVVNYGAAAVVVEDRPEVVRDVGWRLANGNLRRSGQAEVHRETLEKKSLQFILRVEGWGAKCTYFLASLFNLPLIRISSPYSGVRGS